MPVPHKNMGPTDDMRAAMQDMSLRIPVIADLKVAKDALLRGEL